MPKKLRQNWSVLFEEFEVSGLTQAAFCKQREPNPKYFNLKYHQAKLT